MDDYTQQWAADQAFEWAAKTTLANLQKIIVYATNQRAHDALVAIQTIIGSMLQQASDTIQEGSYLRIEEDDEKNLQ